MSVQSATMEQPGAEIDQEISGQRKQTGREQRYIVYIYFFSNVHNLLYRKFMILTVVKQT